MWPRKNKINKEQGRVRVVRRENQTPSSSSPTFSYYANRTPETSAASHAASRQTGTERRTKKFHLSLSQLPFWLLIAVIAACAFKLLALSTNPKVVILGQDATTTSYGQPADVYASAAGRQLNHSLTNRMKLTANVNDVAKALEGEFPELQAVSVTLPLIGNRPIIYVQIAQPSLVLQTSHGNYAVNKTGIILAKLRNIPDGTTTVVDQSSATPVAGKQFLPGSTVAFVQTILYEMKATGSKVSTFILPATAPYEVDLRLEGKPCLIKYNLQADALQQSGAATATMAHLGASMPSSYIDVRTPERVYYK